MTEEKPEILDGSNLTFSGLEFAIRQDLPKPRLEFKSNGEVYYYGVLVEQDKEIIELLKEFILSHRWYV